MLRDMLANCVQTVQQFAGTAANPVIANVTKSAAAAYIADATTSGGTGRAAKDLAALMMTRSWCVTCGIHEGGLGGVAGDADPLPHFTLDVSGDGYHVRVTKRKGNERMVRDLSGRSIALTQSRTHHDAREHVRETNVEARAREYGLAEHQVVKALQY